MANYKDLNDYEIMYMVEENDENAKSLLYEKYKPIVISMASKYIKDAKKCGYELEDLIQEGYVGIYDAINRYRSDMDVMFYTFVIISIKSKMLNCLRVGNSQKNRTLNNSISLDQSLPNHDDLILTDILEDKKGIKPDLEFEINEHEEKIKQYLYSLDFTSSLIFELKLNGFCQREISNLLDLSSSYISKVSSNIRKASIL